MSTPTYFQRRALRRIYTLGGFVHPSDIGISQRMAIKLHRKHWIENRPPSKRWDVSIAGLKAMQR